jgi:hypothetical protein
MIAIFFVHVGEEPWQPKPTTSPTIDARSERPLSRTSPWTSRVRSPRRRTVGSVTRDRLYSRLRPAPRRFLCTASFTFAGAGIRLYASKRTNQGIAESRVDSGTPDLVDLYDTTKRFVQAVFTASGLAPDHTG